VAPVFLNYQGEQTAVSHSLQGCEPASTGWSFLAMIQMLSSSRFEIWEYCGSRLVSAEFSSGRSWTPSVAWKQGWCEPQTHAKFFG